VSCPVLQTWYTVTTVQYILMGAFGTVYEFMTKTNCSSGVVAYNYDGGSPLWATDTVYGVQTNIFTYAESSALSR
jgi:hypothetical protein